MNLPIVNHWIAYYIPTSEPLDQTRVKLVLCIMLLLLVTGWSVKAYRAAHPPGQALVQAKP